VTGHDIDTVQACFSFNCPFVQVRRDNGIWIFLLPCRGMAESTSAGATATGVADHAEIIEREVGLHRNLTPRQLSMIAIGGAIGTGLFLGSSISVKLAGPGVILSFMAAGAIALCLIWALGEMTVAHPVAGSFGVYAEMYVHPWAGFAMRYSYWLAQVIATGSEVVAASIYCQHWFPSEPSWMWIAGFSAALVYVNARSVASLANSSIGSR